MAQDTDPWSFSAVVAPPAEAKVTIRGEQAAPLEMPLAWLIDMVTRWRERNPANFANEYAQTAKRQAEGKIGADGK